ncbi:MAG: LD-carboxypeptidase [Thermodesulfobacteriota bacterium]
MNATAEKPLILPPALAPGATIGLAPLAGPWQEEPFNKGINFLRDCGYQVKMLRHETASEPFLAAPDEERAEIFMELYQDPEVAAVLACRGGYGTMRILPLLDFDIFRHQEGAKSIIGFSDISGLLNVISGQSGLVTFHGPNLTTLSSSDTASQDAFRELLSQRHCSQLDLSNDLEIINPGSAKGILCGGNLTTLAHLLATPYELDWSQKILFLEDVGEPPYRIDRLLSQLALGGHLERISGLLLGQFSNCGEEEAIWQRCRDLLPPATPLWAGLAVGHGRANHWLPLGLPMIMDGSSGQLQPASPYHC